VANETISSSLGYDDATGLPTTTTTGAQTVTVAYDTWGRRTAYTDALGTASSIAYDAAGNQATFTDGAATYVYSYDTHGRLIGVDAGGGVGHFSYAYTSSGGLDTVTYPNGVVAKRGYDEIANQTGLVYAQGSTQLLNFTATLDVNSRTVSQSSTASIQQFSYDQLGQLTLARDTRSSSCVTRTYGFDASFNRSSSATFGPGSAGACQTATATASRTNTYDAAGRLTNPGYTYDTLGRTLTTPQTDAGSNAASSLTANYHADNMIASLSQSVTNPSGGTNVKVMTYRMDPEERINTVTTTTDGTESSRLRYRFADGSDTPAEVDTSADGGGTWTSARNVTVPGAGLAASTTAGGTTLELANLHGDLVATMADAPGAMALSSYAETDEFGNAIGEQSSGRYAWLGAVARSRDGLGGQVLMGARVYNPTTGVFASVDPIAGGNTTAYSYPSDPVNFADPSGCRRCGKKDRWDEYGSPFYSHEGPWHSGAKLMFHVANLISTIQRWTDWSWAYHVEVSFEKERYHYVYYQQFIHSCDAGVRSTEVYTYQYYEAEGWAVVEAGVSVFRHEIWSGWVRDPFTWDALVNSWYEVLPS
jgi:RHS repeat-associated protein